MSLKYSLTMELSKWPKASPLLSPDGDIGILQNEFLTGACNFKLI
jgi:hypothetical protein